MTGVVLWFAFPVFYAAATFAHRQDRCEGRSFTGAFDDCFNDALPIFELLAFPLTLVLAYPFARFAYSMFAPAGTDRSLKWRLAGRRPGAAFLPAFQIAAAIGVGWASFHLASVPFAFRHWYLILYWLLWVGWFVTGALAASPLTKVRARNDR